MISLKPMQLGSPNVTHKCSTMTYGNHLFGVKRSKVKVMKHKNIDGVGHGSLVSADVFYFLIHDGDDRNTRRLKKEADVCACCTLA